MESQSPSPVFQCSSKCRVDLVPLDPPIESHHPAEQFSSALLQRPDAVTRADCLHLFNLLPSTQLRAGVDLAGAKFLCGSFRRGGIHGVLRSTREFPLSTAVLVAFVRSARPDFQFSSIAVHRNVPTSCHRDTNNFTDRNLVCPLSDFSGGSVWVQNPSGTVLRVHEGKQIAGVLHAVSDAPAVIPVRKCLHSTEPWSGDRVVLIAYAGGDHNAMSVSDRTFLQELDFPLPSDSSTDSPPVPWHPAVPRDLQPFLDKAQDRVAGRPLSQLVFLEFFCGSGGLCSAVRRQGLLGSRGIDHQAHAGVKCPVITLDLASPGGQELVLEMLTRPDVVACHFAPPCGTASAARGVPLRGAPGPLRSRQAPDGVPDLSGLSQLRIETANKLYRLISVLVERCNALGILWFIENPNRSLFWATTPIAQLLQCPHLCTRFHHCMFGSQRRKHTLLCHSIPCVQALQVLCDDSHDHLPWGRLPDGGFATKPEVAYPPLLCKCLAHAFVSQLLHLGAAPMPVELHSATLQPARAAQFATLHQPSKRLPPLVSEYASVVTVRGSAALVPAASPLPADWVLPPMCSSHPELRVLPAGSKRLSAFPTSGSPEGLEEQSCICVKFGIPWVPKDFVSQAVRCKHPKLLATALPGALKECIDYCISKTPVEVAQERTAKSSEVVPSS